MNRTSLFIGAVILLFPMVVHAEESQSDIDSAENPPPWLTYSVDAGYAFRHFFTISMHAASLEASLGRVFAHGSIYGSINLLLGGTEAKLFTVYVSGGPSFIFPVSKRIRLGLLPRLSYLGVQRVTQQEFIENLTFGVYGSVSVDLRKFDSMMLYTGLRGGIEWVQQANPETSFWGGTLFAGFRY